MLQIPRLKENNSGYAAVAVMNLDKMFFLLSREQESLGLAASAIPSQIALPTCELMLMIKMGQVNCWVASFG